MSNEKNVILKLENIEKSFGKNKVLNGISLEVAEHDVVVLCGPSGGGKSTLLRTINGLERVDSGSITYRGTLLTKRSLPEFRKHIGMVFQQFNLFHNLTVRENLVAAPVKVKHVDRKDALERAAAYLETFGISDKMDAYPHELSGGQKQRVAIVRALLMEPDIMLFDEPTSALDPEMIKEVLDAMRRLRTMGMTMVIVTHEMGFAREVATRMCFLQDAQIRVNTTTKDFFENPSDPRLQQFLSMILKH